MAQRPKKEVREAILTAAAATFAAVGFERAKLSDVVARAGTSVGNLYKYFANKDELFEAFLPRDFTDDLVARVRARVEALRGAADPFALSEQHRYHRASEELLRFTVEHRDRVVFLLSRSDGTRCARFADDLVRLLVDLALRHARAARPDFAATPRVKRALSRIYRGFIASLASVLEEERTESSVREAIALHTTYHLSGLAAFFDLEDKPIGSAEGTSR